MLYSTNTSRLSAWHLSFTARSLIIIASFILLQTCLPIKSSENLKLNVSFSLSSPNSISRSLSIFTCEKDLPLYERNTVNTNIVVASKTEIDVNDILPYTQKEGLISNNETNVAPSFFAIEPHVFGLKKQNELLSQLPYNPDEHFNLYTPVYKITAIAKSMAKNIGINIPESDKLKITLNQDTKATKRTLVKTASKKTSAALSWPVKGRITSPYGMRTHPITKSRTFHYGIDIKASSGTKIQAPCDGEVIFTGWAGGYGKMARIKTNSGLTLVFAHMTQIACNEGTKIKKGQLVGTVGSTGRSTGPHLHFGIINKKKDFVNPLSYLAK